MRFVKHLLVTGGAGFMGSAFIRFLLRDPGFHGTILNLDALTYAGNLANLKGVKTHPRYRFVHGNINDVALVSQLLEEYSIDTIVHFAAETHVDRSISQARAFVETNVLGTLTLLEAAKEVSGIHFHHVSTDEVYGSLGESGFFKEYSPYRPNSPYSASKASADHLIRAFSATYGLSSTISHSCNNFGPYQYPEKLIPLMISHCMQQKPLPIYGQGRNVRDWLYVDDHAEAIWRILCQGTSGQVYCVGGSQEISNLELVHQIIDLFSQKMNQPPKRYHDLIRFVSDRPGHDYRYALDCSKISRQLHWRPKISLEAGLKKTIQWYLSYGRTQQVGKY